MVDLMFALPCWMTRSMQMLLTSLACITPMTSKTSLQQSWVSNIHVIACRCHRTDDTLSSVMDQIVVSFVSGFAWADMSQRHVLRHVRSWTNRFGLLKNHHPMMISMELHVGDEWSTPTGSSIRILVAACGNPFTWFNYVVIQQDFLVLPPGFGASLWFGVWG